MAPFGPFKGIRRVGQVHLHYGRCHCLKVRKRLDIIYPFFLKKICGCNISRSQWRICLSCLCSMGGGVLSADYMSLYHHNNIL